MDLLSTLLLNRESIDRQPGAVHMIMKPLTMALGHESGSFFSLPKFEDLIILFLGIGTVQTHTERV